MKYLVHSLIILLAIIVISGGCGNSSPSLPPIRGDASGYSEGINGLYGVDIPGIDSKYGDVRDMPRYLEGEVLVVLHSTADANALYPLAKKAGLSLMKEIRLMWGTVYRMRIDNGASVESVINELLMHPEVRYAEPNLIMYPCDKPYYPNDPLFEYPGDADDDPWNHMYDQWGPNHLGASLVWPTGNGSADVAIAVLDTGYRWSHEDLANQIWINEDEIPDNEIDDDENGYIDDWRGWDTNNDDNDPWPDPGPSSGHGTACSGVVAAEQDNGVGCTGMAPGVKVMAIRCDLSGGGGYTSSVIEGVQYAYDNGATAVSMSFRTYSESEIMHETFIATYDGGNGLLPVGAAGNEDSSSDCWPADWPEVMEIGATCSFYEDGSVRDCKRLNAADFGWGSNWGEHLQVMAPGDLYVTTNNGGDSAYYDGGTNGTFGGTSCATPCVAGCVGLLKSYFPDMTAAELKQRLDETADDIQDPGHDVQSGWGRVNIWRAIFGSEPNADSYDPDGFIPLDANFEWEYDNIFDISTSADYDFEDIFVVESDATGAMSLELHPITTGEDLDLEVYLTPELTSPVASSTGPNNKDRLTEELIVPCEAGVKYYVRVFSPGEYNCTNFRLRAETEEFQWWIEWTSLAPPYIFNGSTGVPLLQLDIYTNLLITIGDIRPYVTGDIPLSLANHFYLYKDTNGSGEWEKTYDALVSTASPAGTNQMMFPNLLDVCDYDNPLTYFIVADVGPTSLGYNVTFGAGLRTYKDFGIWQNATLVNDPFPILSDLVIFSEDHDPPVWDTTTGVQDVKDNFESVSLYWNNATDVLSEPTGYNVYYTEDDPPDIASADVIEDIGFHAGGAYDHAASVHSLVNDHTYFFCVRAEDASGNEESNLVWLEGNPNGSSDPEHPMVIGSVYTGGSATEVSVHDQIAYVACGSGGVVVVDCTVPTEPVVVDNYPAAACSGIMYHEGQDLVYAAIQEGLVILDPSGGGSITAVGSYPMANAQDVYVDGDTAYVAAWGGELRVLDVSEPTLPVSLGSVGIGGFASFKGISASDGYVYCATSWTGLKIVDATTPSAPAVVCELSLGSYTGEIALWGDYALVSGWWQQRLYVVDISTPEEAFVAGEMYFAYGQGGGVAVRNDTYVHVGTFSTTLMSIDWSNIEDMVVAGTVETHGADGLFYDGEYLYAAENEDGLTIIL